MKKSAFHYELPGHLIAQRPLKDRRASRLIALNALGEISHCQFSQLLDLVRDDDLLVFNNTRVIPARLHASKSSGGRVEVLVERLLPDGRALAQLRVSKPPKAGAQIRLEDGTPVDVGERQGDFYTLTAAEPWPAILTRVGHMPLPPYIKRADEDLDRERYQTVYASEPGAVAAPTAGLHFDQDLLQQLDARGVGRVEVTLHVAAGTFQPVREDELEKHQMHAEWMRISPEVVAAVTETKARGGRVIAVGTTAVRCLETAAMEGTLAPFEGDTRIFIYPGFRFRVVDALITNFHLPESTLMMLVSAFGGHSAVMAAYREAVAQAYRFFSYGDAMFIEHNPAATEDIPA